MHYVYKISNSINGKIYIGQTNNPEQRWSQHRSAAKRNMMTQIITRAMIAHGVANFTFEVIATCLGQDEVNETEELMIQQYDSCNQTKGYNIEFGGKVGPKPPEVLAKIAEGRKKFHEENPGIWKGRIVSEETRQKISESSMGKDGTNTGKTFDDEWRAKIRKSNAGKDKVAHRRFSPEDEIEICRLYQEEYLSAYKIGQMLNVQRTTVTDIFKRNNVPIKQSSYTGHSNGCNKFTIEQEEEICKDHMSDKFSRAELGNKYKCGKTTIRDILLRHNVKL